MMTGLSSKRGRRTLFLSIPIVTLFAAGRTSHAFTTAFRYPMMARRTAAIFSSMSSTRGLSTRASSQSSMEGTPVSLGTMELVAKDIISSSNTDDVEKWIMGPSKDEFLDLSTKAFSGSETTEPEPGFESILKGIVPTEFNEERRKLYRYLLDGFTADNFEKKNSFVFGHCATANMKNHAINDHDDHKEVSSDDNQLASCILLVDFDPKIEFQEPSLQSWAASRMEQVRDAWSVAVDAITGTLPAPLRKVQNLVTLASRGDLLKKLSENAHEMYGPQEPHLYVNVVAMDPDFQGRGFGKQLMNQVSEIADGMGKACYLECAGEKNPTFYKKFGYRIVHETVVDLDPSNASKGEQCLTLYHMTRDAAPKS